MNNDTIDIKYRFPIFKQEKWKLHKLSEIAEYTNGRAHEQDIDVNGKYVVVNSKYISTDGTVIKYSNTANCLAEKNDILMVLSDVPNGRAIAKCYLVKENNKYTVNQRICRITPKQGIESSLLYYLMNRNPYFLSFDDGVKQTNLRNDDVLNFEILLPSNQAEQQKIAACLISLDNVIAGHEEKLTALEEYKKGLMQNLFPQEGETKPKYRFPEFENDGDWVEINILEISSMKARIGWQNLRTEEHLKQGEFYLVTGIDFKNNRVDWDNAKYVSYDRYIQDVNIILKEGDILITKDGSIGKVAYVSNIKDKKSTLNNGIFRIRTYENYKSEFIFHTFLSTRFKLFLDKLSGGSSIVHLYQKDFEKYAIQLPTNINEQQKIADLLSSVDELIAAQCEKIDALKEHKKGLMQGLFPKVDN